VAVKAWTSGKNRGRAPSGNANGVKGAQTGGDKQEGERGPVDRQEKGREGKGREAKGREAKGSEGKGDPRVFWSRHSTHVLALAAQPTQKRFRGE